MHYAREEIAVMGERLLNARYAPGLLRRNNTAPLCNKQQCRHWHANLHNREQDSTPPSAYLHSALFSSSVITTREWEEKEEGDSYYYLE
jgi:hypothetical protein